MKAVIVIDTFCCSGKGFVYNEHKRAANLLEDCFVCKSSVKAKHVLTVVKKVY